MLNQQKYEISSKSIGKWRTNEDNFKTVLESHKRITLHKCVWKLIYKMKKIYI